MIKTNWKKLIILGTRFGNNSYSNQYFLKNSTTKLSKISPIISKSKKYKFINTYYIKCKY